jgi:two-component system nitrogen regulation sensor histidine kinase NtrY
LPDNGKKEKATGVSQFLLAFVAFMAVVGISISISVMASGPASSGPIYLALINFNLIASAIFIIFIGRHFLLLFLERRKGLVGARLHVRLLGIFSFLAIMPAIVVAVFSVVFLNMGVEAWFSKRVTAALDGSVEVAKAYFTEHDNRLLTEAQALARDPNIKDPTFLIDPDTVMQVLTRERRERNLAEVTIYNRDGSIVAHVGDLAPSAPSDTLFQTSAGWVGSGRLITDYEAGRIAAITSINDTTYLVLTRWIAPAVLNHLDQTRDAYQEYYKLRSEQGSVRMVFSLFFLLITTIVLSGAIWAGLNLASRIVRPITDLVHAANRVRGGDLNVRVEPIDDDEVGVLSVAFNLMTEQMQANQSLMEDQNRELDDRRRTIEAVLRGVSAGVLSLDEKGTVILANRTARKSLKARTGMSIARLSSELEEMFHEFTEPKDGKVNLMQRQLRIQDGSRDRMFMVRMVPQEKGAGGKLMSTVVTFDEVTALLSAQRVAAWADVARRLAHEIKNPLTPIQLSAERLKRKYSAQIHEDADTFLSLNDTIVRNVEELRTMVNEFSDFARMPTPVFGPIDMTALIEEVLVLQRVARPDISFEVTGAEGQDLVLVCDKGQMRRALTNIIENAVNAIQEREETAQKTRGYVKIVVEKSQDGKIVLIVRDNGKGFPDVDTARLFDPYVTTRKKGTGLGLAIVHKVIAEHDGSVELRRRETGGAEVTLTLPPRDLAHEDEPNKLETQRLGS